jgi:hypothetical protein
VLGLVFGVLTFVVGDYLAPLSERQASLVQARLQGRHQLGRSGAWLKDHAVTPRASAATRSTSARPARRRLLQRRPHLRVRCRRPAAAAHRRGSAQVEPKPDWAADRT